MASDRKRTMVGWIGNNDDLSKVKLPDEYTAFPVFRTKGQRDEWGADEWPPRKVRVTIERIDTEKRA